MPFQIAAARKESVEPWYMGASVKEKGKVVCGKD